jgi:hypothetical protein
MAETHNPLPIQQHPLTQNYFSSNQPETGMSSPTDPQKSPNLNKQNYLRLQNRVHIHISQTGTINKEPRKLATRSYPLATELLGSAKDDDTGGIEESSAVNHLANSVTYDALTLFVR